MAIKDIIYGEDRLTLKEEGGKEIVLAAGDIAACKLTGTTEVGIEGFYCDFQMKDESSYTAVLDEATYNQLKRELPEYGLPITLLEAPPEGPQGRTKGPQRWQVYLLAALAVLGAVGGFFLNK